MTNEQLLESAIDLAGGVRELGRALDWNHGNIARAKKSGIIPPHRAMQLAQYVGYNAELAYLTALEAQAVTEEERRLLGKLLKLARSNVAKLTMVATLMALSFQPKKIDIPSLHRETPANIHYGYFSGKRRLARKRQKRELGAKGPKPGQS